MGARRYLLRNKGIGDKTTFVVFRDGTEARTLLAARVVKFRRVRVQGWNTVTDRIIEKNKMVKCPGATRATPKC